LNPVHEKSGEYGDVCYYAPESPSTGGEKYIFDTD